MQVHQDLVFHRFDCFVPVFSDNSNGKLFDIAVDEDAKDFEDHEHSAFVQADKVNKGVLSGDICKQEQEIFREIQKEF